MWKLVGAVLVAAGSRLAGAERGLRTDKTPAGGAGHDLRAGAHGAGAVGAGSGPARTDDRPGPAVCPACGWFFSAVCGRLCRLDQVPFGESWRQAVEELELLSPDAQAALLPLGEVLGRYEADSQRKALEHVRQALEREEQRAQEERRRLGRVYQALGLSGGAFLVILLL